mmetsp:Transcript_23501/g.23711  ORF Transcript_23501/g.23711 Transcript_23501/m.23711 type:complete len:118 (+) Transcript_23501:108-461(+)
MEGIERVESRTCSRVESGRNSLQASSRGSTGFGHSPSRNRSSRFISTISRSSLNSDSALLQAFSGGWQYDSDEEAYGSSRSAIRYIAAREFLGQWLQGKTPLTSCDSQYLESIEQQH